MLVAQGSRTGFVCKKSHKQKWALKEASIWSRWCHTTKNCKSLVCNSLTVDGSLYHCICAEKMWGFWVFRVYILWILEFRWRLFIGGWIGPMKGLILLLLSLRSIWALQTVDLMGTTVYVGKWTITISMGYT